MCENATSVYCVERVPVMDLNRPLSEADSDANIPPGDGGDGDGEMEWPESDDPGQMNVQDLRDLGIIS